MRENIYVEVKSSDEFASVVINHGKQVFKLTDNHENEDIGEEEYLAEGGVVVELTPDTWFWCDAAFYKNNGGILKKDILSYDEYMTQLPKEDMVNHPSHYKQFDRETIDTMKGMSTPEEFRGHLKLTAVKYISRYQGKNGIQDIEKAIWYMERLKKELIDEQSNTTD